jgi:hypothetical protein
MFPTGWLASFFDETRFFLEAKQDVEEGAVHISSSLGQNLKNIELLPKFNKAIDDRKVLRFKYQPFGQDPYNVIFHPQFLKEYNDRWFVLGKADREPYEGYIVPLDRICGDLEVLDDIPYESAPKGSLLMVTYMLAMSFILILI